MPSRRIIARGLATALAVALSLALLTGHAAATVGAYLPTESLVRLSEVIVRGTVVARESAWDADHRRIWTRTTVVVSHWFKGSGPETIVVRTLGGRVGSLVSGVAGMPSFTEGEEVMLFLHPRGEVYVLAGMSQGVYRISATSGGSTASRDLTGMTLLTPTGATEGTVEPPVSITELEALVTSLVGGAR